MSAISTILDISPVREIAPAKINLALHVTGRRPDGYHELDSLVVFADEGDRLTVEPARRNRFECTGPFATHLGHADDNLVLKAWKCFRETASGIGMELPPLAVALEKRLPVASGIGGGSADAAALLRALSADRPALRSAAISAAASLGADVPMCLAARPLRARGLGEAITPLGNFPALAMLLVNPGVPVPTPAVFGRLLSRDNPPLPPLPAEGFPGPEAVADYLAETRNDLEAPAAEIAPAIGEVRDALSQAGALLSRMSGSGGTVFALFASLGEAERAGAAIAERRPHCWVMATMTGASESR